MTLHSFHLGYHTTNLNVGVSGVRYSKLTGRSFFFAVRIKFWFSQDSYWLPFITKGKGFLSFQFVFVSGLNREHDGNGLINHALCEWGKKKSASRYNALEIQHLPLAKGYTYRFCEKKS